MMEWFLNVNSILQLASFAVCRKCLDNLCPLSIRPSVVVAQRFSPPSHVHRNACLPASKPSQASQPSQTNLPYPTILLQ